MANEFVARNGLIAQDTSRITGSLLVTQGNVGIGSATPGATLDVAGNIRAFSFTGSFSGSTAAPGANTQVIYNSSGSLAASSGFVFTGANVGIGTASPSAKLQVTFPANTTNHILKSEAGDNLLALQTFPTTDRMQLLVGSYNGTSSPNIAAIADPNTGIQWAGSDVLKFVNNGSENVTINAVGNIGIGTTSPAYKLDVSGSIRIPNSNYLYINSVAGTATQVLTVDTGDNTILNTPASGDIYLRSNGTTIVRIINNGDVNLGGTSATSSPIVKITTAGNVGIGTITPDRKLSVSGSIAAYVGNNEGAVSITVGEGSTGATSNIISLETNATNNTTRIYNTGTSTSLNIGSTGTTSDVLLSSVRDLYFKVNNAGDVFAGTTALYVNSSTNVGIGTTSPIDKLHVEGSSSGPGIYTTISNTYNGIGNRVGIKLINFYGGVSYSASIYADWTGQGLIFQANRDLIASQGGFEFHSAAGSAQVVIRTNSGNVGIGTTSPSTRLHVAGGGVQIGDSVTNSINLRLTRTSAGVIADANYFTATANTPVQSWIEGGFLTSERAGTVTAPNSGNPYYEEYIGNGSSTSKTFGFINATSGSSFTSTALTGSLVLLSNRTIYMAHNGGNVGIGSTSPGAKLDVNGNVRALSFTGSFSGSSAAPGANTEVIFNSSGSLAASSSFIFNGANVGIGTTTLSQRLSIGSADSDAIIINVGGKLYFRDTSTSIFEGSGLNLIAGSSRPMIFSADGSERMRIALGGNVGIGTSSPSAYLDVRGLADGFESSSLQLRSGNTSANFSSNQIVFGYANTAQYRHAIKTRHQAGSPSGNSIDFYVWRQGTDAVTAIGTQHVMSINGGSVGIGTTSPTAFLHVSGTTGGIFEVDGVNGTNALYVSSSGNVGIGTTSVESIANTTTLTINGGTGGGATSYQVGGVRVGLANGNDNYFTLQSYNSRPLSLGYNSNNTIVINTGNNVGIGTTSPTAKLDVSGSARITGATTILNTLTVGTTSGGNISITTNQAPGSIATPLNMDLNFLGYADNTKARIRSVDLSTNSVTSYLSFWTVNPSNVLTEYVRLDTNGNLGIGSTSPIQKLDVSGSTRITNDLVVSGSITGSNALFTGTLTAQTLVVTTVSSSVVYSSGSNIFGNQLTNVQQFTGSLRVTGSGDHWILGGNIGVGTTAPTRGNLTVQGNWIDPYSSGNGQLAIISNISASNASGSGNGAVIVLGGPASSTDLTRTFVSLGGFKENNVSDNRGGYFSIGVRSGIAGSSDIVERFRINSSGSVGIGSSIPGTTLDVVGNIRAQSLTGSLLGTASIATTAINALTASSADTFIIRGSVGIGTTNAGYKVNIVGNTNNTGFINTAGIYSSTANIGFESQIMALGTQGAYNAGFELRSTNTGVASRLGMSVSTGDTYLSIGTTSSLSTVAYFKADGNVGINQTSPSQILDVSGRVKLRVGSSSSPGIWYTGATGTEDVFAGLQGVTSTDSFGVYSGGAWRFTILNGGNVGIGSTSPGATLDVVGNVRAQSFTGSFSGSSAAPGTNTQVIFNSSGSLAASSEFIFTGANIGIGTTAPAQKLHVSTATNYQGILINGSNAPSIGFVKSTTTTPEWKLGISGNDGSGFSLSTGASNADVLFVSSSGNLGIGTTTPTSKLSVSLSGAANQRLANFRNTGGNSYIEIQSSGAGAIALWAAADNTFSIYQNSTAGTIGTSVLYVSSSGVMGIGTTSIASGARLHINGYATVPNNSGWCGLSTSGNIVQLIGLDTSNRTIIGTTTSGNVMTLTGTSVGIGTTTPQTGIRLDVSGSIAVAGGSEGLRIGSVGDNSAYDNVKLYYSGYNGGFPFIYLTPRTTPGSGVVNTYFHLLNSNSGSTTSNNTMGLLVDGSVGIGTTSPTTKLHVSGTTGGVFEVDAVNGTNALYVSASGAVGIGTTNPGAYRFYVNGGQFGTLLKGGDLGTGSDIVRMLKSNDSIAMLVRGDGNVGIGSTSPGATLDVVGNVRAQSFTGSFSGSAAAPGANTQVVFNSSGSLSASSNFVFDGTNVGIGTTTPNAKLTISASSGDLATFYTGTTNVLSVTTAGNLSFNTNSSLGLLWSPASLKFEGQTLGITARPYASNYVSFTVAGAASQTANLQTWQSSGGTVYSAVNATGSLGIGTSTPAYMLDVAGNARAVGTITRNTLLQTNTDNHLVLTTTNTAGDVYTTFENSGDASSAWAIGRGNDGIFRIAYSTGATYPSGTTTSRIVIDTNGNVGIGSTSPTSILDTSVSSGATSGFRFKGFSDASTPYLLSLGTQTYQDIFQIKSVNGLVTMGIVGAIGSAPDLAFQTNTTERMRILSNGNVGIGSSSPAYALDVNGTARVTTLIETSSKRYKKNIKKLSPSLPMISSLRPVTFNWKDKAKGEDLQYGLIAEEVLTVIPEAVSINDKGEAEAISYTKLIPVLIKAVQELQTKVEKLEKQLSK